MDRDELCRLAVTQAESVQRTVLVSWCRGAIEQDLQELRRVIGHGCQRGFYWSSPNTNRRILALGVAYEIPANGPRWRSAQAGWARLAADCAVGDANPLLVGGGSYAATAAPPTPAVAFWVPELQFEAGDGQPALLTVNTVCHPGDRVADVAARLAEVAARAHAHPATPAGPVGPLARFQQVPGFADWSRRVDRILHTIDSGELEKVVLARTFEVEVGGRFGIGRILDELDARQPESIIFAVSWDQTTFIGATPEPLFTIEGAHLRTVALAASAPRAADPREDARLGQSLQASAKERHEHALVADYIADTLARLGVDVTADTHPQLIQYPGIQHLATRIEGKLDRNDVAFVFDAIEALHPTPAVGGVPRAAAVEWQRAHEGIDRGWYSAPLGWVDSLGNAEIAVGIRSALVRPQQAVVYAGCGIVAGSDARAEYEETRIKATQMLTALLPRDAMFDRG